MKPQRQYLELQEINETIKRLENRVFYEFASGEDLRLHSTMLLRYISYRKAYAALEHKASTRDFEQLKLLVQRMGLVSQAINQLLMQTDEVLSTFRYDQEGARCLKAVAGRINDAHALVQQSIRNAGGLVERGGETQ